MRRRLASMLLFAQLALTAVSARADWYVVVNVANPQATMVQREVVDLFMGRTRTFSGGEFALVFDLPRDHPEHAAFFQALTGMGPSQVNSYWSRLMFSGQAMPPQPLPNEAGMVEVLKRNPNAIGWLPRDPADKQLRVLLVLKAAAP